MKVVAISSSPSMGKSNTSLILDPFLEGMRKAGAETELFYTGKLDIKPCQGEFICWTRTPGECHIKDDMQWLLPKLGEADVWVLATPLYIHGVSGPLKNLLDRTIPFSLPWMEQSEGRDLHPARKGARAKIVLVSNCGFWSKNNFDALLAHMEALCGYDPDRFAGALLRPHGPAFKAMLEMGADVKNVIEAAREAGRQLVRDGAISRETQDAVSRDLLPPEEYAKHANQEFQQAIDGGAQVGQ